MTLGAEKASKIRQLRERFNISYESLGRLYRDWLDPSATGTEQELGLTLCKLAASHFGESEKKAPWHDPKFKRAS